jgi:hypothetical protein
MYAHVPQAVCASAADARPTRACNAVRKNPPSPKSVIFT